MKKQAIIDRYYSGSCSSVLTTIFNDKRKRDRTFNGFFMESYGFEKFQKALTPVGIEFDAAHVWDYDLQYNGKLLEMKLFWTLNLTPSEHDIIRCIHFDHNTLFWDRQIPAFSFLQPEYLQYMDKPFNNRHAYTQVNLLLDYHRQQKRHHGVDIFSLVDLVAFKMAIDDNRLDYENCEFHKLIASVLDEAIKNDKFVVNFAGPWFDLNEYLNANGIFDLSMQTFEFLVYHFQNTLKGIIFEFPGSYININFQNVRSPFAFVNVQNINNYDLRVNESDPTHKASNILYEILIHTKANIKIIFELDGEWNYAGLGIAPKLNVDQISGCEITISTKNHFHFIENFINWLKLSFGALTKYLTIILNQFQWIRPYIFFNFHVNILKIQQVVLDLELVRMLRHCKYDSIEFRACSLVHDRRERIECLGHRKSNDQNSIMFLENLNNVKIILFWNQEHTIGTIWKYVTYTMEENVLTEFKFRNPIWIGQFCLLDIKFCMNKEANRIEIVPLDEDKCEEIYKYFGLLPKSEDQDEFDFYQ